MGASACPKLKFAKGTPPVVDQLDEQRKQELRERKARAAVRARDGRFCVVCGWRLACEVHEKLFRSLGGEVSLENSIYVCAKSGHGLCHQLLQAHRIEAEGTDCSKRLTFRMARKYWQIVRPQPSDERRKIVIER